MDQKNQRSLSSAAPPRTTARQSPGLVQAKPANVRQPLAPTASARGPIAPPPYRAPAGPKILQAKMNVSTPAGRPSRMRGGPPSGVVQANVIGGNPALQARLNLWSTRPTRGTSLAVQPGKAANLAGGAGASNSSRAIQRKSGPGVEAFRVPLQPKSGGQPIPDQVRAKMENALGADFSDVRVHIGQEAAALGAIAYTWGTNIHFAPGQYNPNTIQGQKLLGHELWHVVQQRAGRVSNPFGGGVAVVQDHALEAEADRMGVKAAMTAMVQKPGDQR